MNYRTIPDTGDRVSALGYGCMRFPRKGAVIDQERTRKQVLYAIKRGVNYFDTAYLYPGSEKTLGNILAQSGLRKKVKIASKLPHMLIKNRADMQTIFQKQLDDLQTDYIDYYLIHNIANWADWQRMKDLGIISFIEELRKQRRIIYFGFSFHGNIQTFRRLIDDYPWDFCQIQYNYLDENFQAGTQGLHYAAEKGLGIIVMEPLRGGILGEKIPPGAEKLLRRASPDRSPAEWALRWLLSHPQISVVLSGMGVEAHIKENIRVASSKGGFELSPRELACLKRVKSVFAKKIKVPCTGCAYCLPCPFNVDIPGCFALYNAQSAYGGLTPVFHYINSTEGVFNGTPSRASNCKNCGICVKNCPQQIDIPEELKQVARKMEKPYLRIPARFFMKLMSR